MSSPSALPLLDVADFGPGLDHEVNTFVGGKVIAITHRLDPALALLSGLSFPATDPYTYVFVHGGLQSCRFEDLEAGTHEIPVDVVVALLTHRIGPAHAGLMLRLCSCYGNLVRPGDPLTLAQRFAAALPSATVEAYHGLIRVVVGVTGSSQIRLGVSVQWDPTLVPPGALVVGPPRNWESV